jgi:hypothetical protein
MSNASDDAVSSPELGLLSDIPAFRRWCTERKGGSARKPGLICLLNSKTGQFLREHLPCRPGEAD